MLFWKQKIILFVFSFFLLFSIAIPQPAAAALVPCGGYNTEYKRPCTVEDIFVLVAKVTNFLIGVSGVYAVYVICNNAFWMIVSMGNEEAITKTKEGMTNAIIGFVLVLFAYMLINTVVNVLLTRSLVTGSNPNCKLDLANPLTFLKIDEANCTTPVGPHPVDHGLTPIGTPTK